MSTHGHRTTASLSQGQNHKAQLASAYNELGKELSSQKIRVVGNYTLGRIIGEGTYGKVRMGVHRFTGTKVAIKQIPKAMSSSLTREIHHHRQLHHPHVTQLYEVIATETNIWLVTELCSGGELFDYLAEKGRLEEDETRTLFGQLCLAVAYVHNKGIVHRDLKLENVLLDERCRVKLGDFGFTREFDKGTLLETFCGTTGYASPEMLLSKKYLGPEVDIWSLGVILYTLLTGTLPFDDDDDSVMREKVIKGVFEDPEWLTDEARDLIKKILMVDPTKRLTIAQILAHPWFTMANATLGSLSSPSTTILVPSLGSGPQLTATTSVTSNATFHSANCESFPTTPLVDEPISDVFQSSPLDTALRQKQSELTLKILTAVVNSDTGRDNKAESNSYLHADDALQPSLSRSTTVSNMSSKGPPAHPSRTPARTKRRSVSSTLSNADGQNLVLLEGLKYPAPPQDFSSLLSTPAPIIFSTPLERDLLNNLSALGFDTGQIVHSVLTDACDATGSLWWMLKRKAERRTVEEGSQKTSLDMVDAKLEHKEEVGTGSKPSEKDKDKETKSKVATRPPHEPVRGAPSPPIESSKSAPELHFTPSTPTGPAPGSVTPPRSRSPNNPTLSPTPSVSLLETTIRSHPSTPGGSLREKEKDKDKDKDQGSKGRKARAGSVSIMQRATTALEAAGLVRKKSAEVVREEREREKSGEKRPTSGHGDESRPSHGSQNSNKLTKSPPLKPSKEGGTPTTPPHSLDVSPHTGTSWFVVNGKNSPPQTPSTSPGDTVGSLPSIPNNHSTKVGPHRNRASLLTAFRMWFKEDPKGKRKEQPALNTQGLPYNLAHQGQTVSSPGSSPVGGRGRGSVKQRIVNSRGKINTGRKTGQRVKRASMSSRRSSSVNSKRSSIASTQFPIMETPQYSPDHSVPIHRQRSDPSRKSFGSRTPNSERDEHASRPSSMQSFHHHRHHKSPSASSAGSVYGSGRTASPLPKYHRRAGSGSSTRVVRHMQSSGTTKGAHLRSNSTSSNHSLASSRRNSLYELSESEGLHRSPSKATSLDDTPRRASTFVAQKRQTPFAQSNYLNSIGRSSWKKSWGLEPPGWQNRPAYPAVEVLAVSDGSGVIRDVFTSRPSLTMGDESDWIDEEDDTTGYLGGLGQPITTTTPSAFVASLDSPVLPPASAPKNSANRAPPPAPKHPALTTTSTNGRQGRGKGGGRSPAGRSSPLPGESSFDNSGRRSQLPVANRSGPAAIQEEDEDEEE